MAVGEKVEADYAGKGKYYPGKITLVGRDGTYDVTYDDGDKEEMVDMKRIRSLNTGGGGSSSSGVMSTRDIILKTISKPQCQFPVIPPDILRPG